MSDPRPPAAVRWTFVVATHDRPAGGDLAAFEIAEAIARLGRDAVAIVHVPILGRRAHGLGDIPWFDFDRRVVHQFATDLDPARLPDGDVLVYSPKLLAGALLPEGGEPGRRLIDALRDTTSRIGLPIVLLQGHGVFSPEIEELALSLPGPKVCVGSWLAELVVTLGVPAGAVTHIPNGVDPERFRITRPIAGRPAAVSMNFDPHPVKGGDVGIEALARIRRDLAVPGTVFGTRRPEEALPLDLQFAFSPDRPALAELYNGSSLFLQPSRREGFGLCAVEAMACGCALVTTANGGSADYAIDEETALVCGPEVEEMTEALARLVDDDGLRVRLATNGAAFVERFRWSTSAERLTQLADGQLGASPGH